MLLIELPEREWYDEVKEEFVTTKKESFQIEHSLVSLSKWESKWCKPFLSKDPKDEKSEEEILDYVRCMTITQNVNPNVYLGLPSEISLKIERYINLPMTATWFSDGKGPLGNKPGSREVITAEVIYYWMIAQNIPMECQKWHLNKLLTLIRVCNIKNAPPKKQNRREMFANRTAINQARRAQYNTKG